MQRVQALEAKDGEQDKKLRSGWVRQAKVLWRDGRRDQAIRIMSDLEERLESACEEGIADESDMKMLARVLSVNAGWLSTTRTMRWEGIKAKMERGLDVRGLCSMPIAKAHYKLASFMDGMYCHEEEEWNQERMEARRFAVPLPKP